MSILDEFRKFCLLDCSSYKQKNAQKTESHSFVQIVSVTRWSKKQKAQIPGRSMELDDWKWKAMGIRSSGWDDSDTSSSISKKRTIPLVLF
ncbi:hypothetical protein P3S67_011949 [Capsicum chacoense]